MRLTQLKAKAATLLGQMEAASAAAGDRAMTPEERTAFGALETEHAAVCENIATEERLQSTLRAARTAQPVDADQAAAAAAQVAAGLQSAPLVQLGADRTTQAPGYFGRQLMAVRNAALSLKGGDVLSADDRALLRPMQAAATGLNTDVPSEGGFLVAQERASGILQRAYLTGQVLSRVNRMPIGAGSNGMKLPAIDETSRADSSRFGGIVSGWLGQGNTLTAGKPKFRELDLKLRKVGAFVYSTDELIVDAVALEAWVNRYLPLELTFRTEDAVVNGVGGNQPLGFLNSPAVISVTRTLASHVLYEDVSGMWKRMWAPLRQNAVWFVEQSVEQDLEQMAIAIGTAGVLAPIYKAAGSVPGQVFPTLYGRPVITVEYNAALGTAGDITLVNLDEYTLIDKGGVESAVSMHVAFLTDEAVFRFLYRVDGQLSWNAALTPKSGGATLSPVVALTT